MQLLVKSSGLKNQIGDCLIVAIYQDQKLSKAATVIDEATGGAISQLISMGDIQGDIGQTLWSTQTQGIKAKRLLLVGAGKENNCSVQAFQTILNSAATEISNRSISTVVSGLNMIEVKERDIAWKTRQEVIAFGQSLYQFSLQKKRSSKTRLQKLIFHNCDRKTANIIKSTMNDGDAISQGINLSRDLSNLPGNICTPSYLADEAKMLAKQYSTIKTTVLSEKQMERLGMGALLSVSRGSRQEAKLIIMEYQGIKPNKTTAKQKPVVLVGKGLTFDAGGISIKPSAQMDEMKYDMCGGASVFGTIKAIAEMKLPINVVGVVPSSENLPDGAANKPGDIVTSMSGQTIEILNTDAEGRLILCDALTYVKRFNPDVVIDIATLTGACVIALGSQASGVLGNNDNLINELLDAGQNTGDRAWQLPIWDEYDQQLKSNFADMANIGGREAGTITAGCFLARYTKNYKWAHIDIAGTAWTGGANKGATGRPVPLLTQFLLNRCHRG